MTSGTEYQLTAWDRSLFEPAMEQAPDAVIVTTGELEQPGPTIVYANPAFCRMTGYTRDELLGKTPRILQGPDTDTSVLRELRAALARYEPFLGSTVNYRKDGNPYTVEWSITPVRDRTRGEVYFVSIQRAIDDRLVREKYLETVLQAAPAGILLVDAKGTIEIANGIAEELFGYADGALAGRSVETLVPDHLAERHAWHRAGYSRDPRARQMGRGRDLEGQRSDGTRFPLEVGLTPVSFEGATKILASVIDIGERKRAEQALVSRSVQRAALIGFGQAALEEQSLGLLQRQAVQLTCETFGFEAALLAEVASSGEDGRVAAHWGWAHGELVAETITVREDDPAGRALAAGEAAIATADEMRSSWASALPGTERFGAVVCVPVVEPTQQWGILYAFCGAGAGVADNDVQALTGLAQTLASATRRERDYRRLQEAEHLRSVAERVAHVGGWSVDLETWRMVWSDEVCAIHDMPPGSAVNVDEGIGFYAPEWRERIREAFTACAREGTPYDEEVEIITAAGRRRTVRSIGEAVRDRDGVIREVRGAFQDITEQRQTEKSLLQSRQQFRQLADAMPGIVWTAEPDGTLDYANQRFVELAGVTQDELPQDGWLRAVHPDDRDRCLAAWGQAVAEGTDYAIDFRIYRQADATYRWHYVSAVPIRDEAEAIRKWYGSAMDIHDRKDLEEELVSLADRLTQTLESITDGFYTLDSDWRVTYFNREAERLLRVSRETLLGENLWETFPEAAGTVVEDEYRYAMRVQVTRSFEYYFVPLAMWFEIHAYPSDNGLTVYFRDITERKSAEAEIEFLAFYDPLTGLPNRRQLVDRLQQTLERKGPSASHACVIFIDLDHFKTLNDTLGHSRGDDLLKNVARRLEAEFGDTCTLARIGGDEFAVIVDGLGSSAEEATVEAERAGQRVLAALDGHSAGESGGHHRTCSVGITLLHPGRDSTEEVMKRADLVLYQAKNLGRNMVSVFDPALQESANARALIESEMPAGIQAGEFVPYYQPRMTADGRCVGVEALVRWHHPRRGLVSPGEFIPLAEETGLIRSLGASVLRSACRQIARWADDGERAGLIVSVNVSARQFHEPGFVDEVRAIIADTGVDPGRLQLEVTESLLVEDLEHTVGKMDELRALGVTFAVDDFGTGYSSLAYLKRLPLDVLKIDQSFVQDVLTDASDVAIVQTIIALGQSLGLEVLAEGVETEGVRDFLTREGCHAFQGYLFSRPLPAHEFEGWLARLDG
ncbi:PAS domain S-box protein [Aquisalimonas lutea]|uniref:sensor domain-containing protein n=1 Tax=Aquisalimonas lutea TaxID=1327750 RepID=UPI0025B561AA|nr:EAL domain-containing protein [Aquisalimonas lutea]MDN3517297.1 PAS domain S-box protein [Aquisalimonas lutea]